jgi:hypothetical protein
MNKLKTPLGKPQETFLALEGNIGKFRKAKYDFFFFRNFTILCLAD